MVKNLVVVHYGKNRFIKSKFIKIKNSPYWVKPDGGLWTSPVDSKWSWKEWCDSEPVNLYGWDVETVLVLNKKCCFEPHTRVVLSEKILSLQK